ncbi:hypothetical protein KC909_01330 [Candidatus Dojkabacteria bacterium]|uniref:Uncharacterized protein n=1 Tax=Candidatus Dojkabacteria bacterium TaxID=2099670 RepID=A0A955L5F1_9BACT|nr:hypothetical protein [Candidatus Dojkabacteria bacterium]
MALSNNNYNQAVLDKVNRPHKKRSTNSKSTAIFIVVILVIFIFVIGLAFSGKKDNNSDSEISVSPTPVVTPTVEPTSEASNRADDIVILDITGDTDAEAIANNIYYVTQNGEDKLFYLVPILDDEDNVTYEGYITTGNYSFESQEYADLNNPIRIASIPTTLTYIVDFKITSDNSEIYISVVERISEFIEKNVLYKIDLQSKNSTEVWSRILHDESYEDLYGSITINGTIDKWIEATMLECFGCDGDVDSGVLIININNGNDLLLGDATDLTFDTESSTIEYTVAGARKTSTLP